MIEALMTTPTQKMAAEKLGCTPVTVSNRVKDPEFRKKYDEARAGLIKSTRDMLQRSTCNAVSTMVHIMQDKRAPTQTRLNAAEAILKHGARYTEIGDVMERIKALEANDED